MSERIDKKVKVSLFTLIIGFFATLAQADATQAQSSACGQEGGLSPLHLFRMPYSETNASASTSPALRALADVAGAGTGAAGGLWLSGDTARGFAHLIWIAGDQPEGLLKMDRGGKVSFDLRILARVAGVTSENAADQKERIATFLRSDEGLRLLAEVTNGAYRFLLHVGSTAPTLGGKIRFNSVRNLDNRFDMRINPRRPSRQKLENECPPKGFDSMIAINPDARWFNIHSRQLLSTAQIAFHELAEAHARQALGLDYLPERDKPGAHDVAIGREIKLKQERPGQYIVMPIGYNNLIVSRDGWLQLSRRLREQRRAKPSLVTE